MDKALIDGCWFFVGASFDAATGMMSIFQEERITKTNGRFSSTYNMDPFNKEEIKKVEFKPEADNHAAFVIGSVPDQKVDKKTYPLYKYNGKIERPILHNQALTKQDMADQLEQPAGSSVVGAWNFSKGITKEGIPVAQLMFGRAPVVQREDMYLGEHAEYGLSTYDHHYDGSGVCYTSALRPILNMRPL